MKNIYYRLHYTIKDKPGSQEFNKIEDLIYFISDYQSVLPEKEIKIKSIIKITEEILIF